MQSGILQKIDSPDPKVRVKTLQDPDLLQFIVILFSKEMTDNVCKIIKYQKYGFNE